MNDQDAEEVVEGDHSEQPRWTFIPPPGYRRARIIRRRILPRRPTRDASLEQDCIFYHSFGDASSGERGLLVMVPHVDVKENVPYYHPVLRKLAFRYSAPPLSHGAWKAAGESANALTYDQQPEIRGTISVSILPFVDELAPMTPTTAREGQVLSSDVLPNRTYRTCLHLLETLHKHGWGRLTGYQKRVVHDVRRIICDMYISISFQSKLPLQRQKNPID